MAGLDCDVCGGSALGGGVCASALGAISFAYCTDCLQNNAEPAGLLYTMIKWDIGGLDRCADWVRSLSIFFEGRYWTAEEFMAVNRDHIFPDIYNEQYPCGVCGTMLVGPMACPTCYPETKDT